jgi:predicted kinase
MKLKNKIIMLIGAPASGKSTHAEKLAAEYNAAVISTDRIRAALYGNESIQGYWPDIEAVLYKDIKNAIKANKNIILDSTHYKKEYRAKIINQFSLDVLGANSSEFSAYYFNYPFALIYRRNKHRPRRVPFEVLAAMYSELSAAPPLLSEGFKSIKKMYANF